MDGAFTSPGSRAELVPNAGHFLQYEQPAHVNGLVSGFLVG
jgi:pimeloyl-ACP methyl ester carboxylesterase